MPYLLNVRHRQYYTDRVCLVNRPGFVQKSWGVLRETAIWRITPAGLTLPHEEPVSRSRQNPPDATPGAAQSQKEGPQSGSGRGRSPRVGRICAAQPQQKL